MNLTGAEKTSETLLYERYSGYTDTQIVEILKKHKDYQEVAVKIAVQIAIERGLIHSEQDLIAPEFQETKSHSFSLFPEITSDFHRKKLIGSIFRILYLITLLPLVYAVLRYTKGEISMAMVGFGVGVLWLLLIFLLGKTRKPLVFIPLFLLIVVVAGVIGENIISRENIQTTDLFTLVVGSLLPSYLILYLKKLIRKRD